MFDSATVKMKVTLLLLIAVASVGCSPSLTTIVLKPDAVAQDCTSDNDHNEPWYLCPLPGLMYGCWDSTDDGAVTAIPLNCLPFHLFRL
jgi:hypothetical protein